MSDIASAVTDHGILEINPDCRVKVVELFDGYRCAIVDNFLINPLAAREYGLSRASEFVEIGGYYPGPELGVPADLMTSFDRWWRRNLCEVFGIMRGGASSAGRYSIYTKRPHELGFRKLFPHQDVQMTDGKVNPLGIAGVLYLFDDLRLGGTSFFRRKEGASFEEISAWKSERRFVEMAAKYPFYFEPPRFMIDSNSLFERMYAVEAAFNRAVFFDRSTYHSPDVSNPELVTPDFATGRFTINLFIDASRAPDR